MTDTNQQSAQFNPSRSQIRSIADVHPNAWYSLRAVGGSDVLLGGSDDVCSVELSVECADCGCRTLDVILSEDNEIIGGQPVNLAKVCRRHTVVSKEEVLLQPGRQAT